MIRKVKIIATTGSLTKRDPAEPEREAGTEADKEGRA